MTNESDTPLEPEPAETVEHPTICLHDFGDVTLLIGPDEDPQPVLVSISTLRLASPVWKAMFETRWVESEASEIPLPDDDVDAMLLVLRIAHLRFHELPKTLEYKALFNLAVVCDKYDLVHLVRPFLDLWSWAKPYFYTAGQSNSFDPSWLFVAWTFGYTESFRSLAKHISLEATLNYDPVTLVPDRNQVLMPTGGVVLEREMPPGIIGTSIPQSLILPEASLRVLFSRLDNSFTSL
jgi:hypothetical protein